MKKTYDQVALDFTIDSEPVEGVLDGDYIHWTFTSKSPSFLRYVADGVLHSSAGWKGSIPKEIHMLYKSIWTAAEAKGYSFDQ
jgi:hypothetical protein